MNHYIAIVLLCTFAHKADLCTEETAVKVERYGPYYNWHVCMKAGSEAAILISHQVKLPGAGWFRIRCPRDLPA